MEHAMVSSGFREKKVRRILQDNELWFVLEDVCALVLEEEQIGMACWSQVRKILEHEGCNVNVLCRFLPLCTDGKVREFECATLEGIFRIVQSISTPKAEVFKRWLAELGADQVIEPGPPQTNLAAVFAMLEDTAAIAISLKKDCRKNESKGKSRKCAVQIAGEARANLRKESTPKLLNIKN